MRGRHGEAPRRSTVIMASSKSRELTGPDDWITVAERELKNLSGSYRGRVSNDAKIDHALRATEGVLKAIMWKHEGWTEWPLKGRKETDFIYRHNLDTLLDRCGLRTRLQMSPPHRASWQILVNAVTKQYRYSLTPPSDAEANAVAKCTRFPDTGVVPWLLNYYHRMR